MTLIVQRLTFDSTSSNIFLHSSSFYLLGIFFSFFQSHTCFSTDTLWIRDYLPTCMHLTCLQCSACTHFTIISDKYFIKRWSQLHYKLQPTKLDIIQHKIVHSKLIYERQRINETKCWLCCFLLVVLCKLLC